jgi:hypothetical protein
MRNYLAQPMFAFGDFIPHQQRPVRRGPIRGGTRMLRRHLLSTSALLALGGLLPATVGTAEAKPNKGNGLLIKNATGAWTAPASNATGTLTADILIQRLRINPQSRTLIVEGLISSTGGGVVPTITSQAFSAPATLTGSGTGAPSAQQLAVCQILNLDIGRITLNLLGLVIDIAPISIDITANPFGGLLGQLLCALANLLSGTGPLGQIQSILAQINQILRSVLLILSLPTIP